MAALLGSLVCFLYYTSTISQALPTFRSQSTRLDSTVESCNAFALESVMNSNPQVISDFQFDMHNGNTAKALMDSISSDSINQFSDNLITRTYLDNAEINNYARGLLTENVYQDFSLAFQKCLDEYITTGETIQPSYKTDAVFAKLHTPKVIEQAYDNIFNVENSKTVKRTKTAGFNPTGWRKRRSDSNDNERLDQFMHNMHELLEKRQKLQFNPTGW